MERRLSYLSKWLNKEFRISSEQAQDFLRREYQNSDQSFSFNYSTHKLNCSQIIINAFSDPSSRFKVDDTSGRLHTLLTVLKSELRAFLTYSNRSLLSLDIKNSQPLLSLVFLDEELFTKNGILERVMIYNESFKNGNENTSLAKLLYNLIRKASSFSDTLDYREKVSTGT